MKVGVFDSGLGGLIITKKLIQKFPQYDFVYLGDTKRVPYGDKSEATIYTYLQQGVEFLFQRNCGFIIIACNTASANALRKIQQQYLQSHYPNRRVLGVIVPTAEVAAKYNKVGLLATHSTVQSRAYERELHKLNKNITIISQAAPLLVPRIETNDVKSIEPILHDYLKPFKKSGVEAVILGCTHYSILKPQIQKILGSDIKIISQTNIIPKKLDQYLLRHPEIQNKLSKNASHQFYVTKLSASFLQFAHKIMKKPVSYKIVSIK